METEQSIEVLAAIATLVPKQMTLTTLAKQLNITVDRLEAIKAGVSLTETEAKAFARLFGGTYLDYRLFNIQEDTWWQEQPASLQARIQHLIEQATYGPKKLLANAKVYSKNTALCVMVTVITIAAAISHGLWLEYRYKKMRPEASRYMARIYNHRQIAWAQAGIEVANAEINNIKRFADLLDKADLKPKQRAAAQRILLDLARYYKAVASNYQHIQEQIKYTLEDPSHWRNSNLLLDPFTFQPIDVEDIDGGQLKQEKITELLRLQLRTKDNQQMLQNLLNGSLDTQLPSKDSHA